MSAFIPGGGLSRISHLVSKKKKNQQPTNQPNNKSYNSLGIPGKNRLSYFFFLKNWEFRLFLKKSSYTQNASVFAEGMASNAHLLGSHGKEHPEHWSVIWRSLNKPSASFTHKSLFLWHCQIGFFLQCSDRSKHLFGGRNLMNFTVSVMGKHCVDGRLRRFYLRWGRPRCLWKKSAQQNMAEISGPYPWTKLSKLLAREEDLILNPLEN